jgi:hypothetical protein
MRCEVVGDMWLATARWVLAAAKRVRWATLDHAGPCRCDVTNMEASKEAGGWVSERGVWMRCQNAPGRWLGGGGERVTPATACSQPWPPPWLNGGSCRCPCWRTA